MRHTVGPEATINNVRRKVDSCLKSVTNEAISWEDGGMDPRIARTRRSLQQALLELARTRGLDAVTIADIAEQAGVNRSSFYQHYSDKDTLLADAIEAALFDDGAALPPLTDLIDCQPPTALVAYLAHFEANAAVYQRVFGEHGSPAVLARLRTRIMDLAREGIGTSETHAFDGMPVDVAAAGITGSVIAVLGAWITMDPRPSVEIAASWILRVLVGPGEVV